MAPGDPSLVAAARPGLAGPVQDVLSAGPVLDAQHRVLLLAGLSSRRLSLLLPLPRVKLLSRRRCRVAPTAARADGPPALRPAFSELPGQRPRLARVDF